MNKLPQAKTVAEISRLVGGTVRGDGHHLIESVATLTDAGPRDISFLENQKYAAVAAAVPAGCLLLPPSAQDSPCAAKAQIIVPEPRGAFAVLLKIIEESRRAEDAPSLSAKASIHPSAKLGEGISIGDFCVIGKNASIGAGTTLLPHCYVGANARLGRGCRVYPRVVIRDDCEIGDRVILHPGVVIGGDGFGFTTDKKTGRHTKVPQIGNVVIGDDVEIGANTTIDRAALGSTVIGAGTQIDNLVQIGHNVVVGRDCVIVALAGIAGSTKIGDGVILGGQVGVAGHLTIADRTQVGAQSGIMSTVEPAEPGKPPHVLFGSPARPHREAFKLQALFGRLPELFEKMKELEKKLDAQ